ncbi:PepSY-associated TM helix domain-containing protein [Methylobacterium tarhaniae]|uniref:PepSY-associated TM helix domain-containing protein n=1 Tax=Methylobacterium tarhaniae TaxID=1187852 RepID=A0A0J6VKZ7_9HYPH|nr:PepSY domain-containing protein [Methylobacterium tarhaniae]KMO39821.1 PepSY-associated TM helix domain-containing protein [Methylobacterium tarhaniae]
MLSPSSAPVPGRARLRDALHRAVWRWHFYAGLLCLPFLILLSATGSVYLFKDEINRTLFSHRTIVPVRASPPLSPERLIFIAADAVPDAQPTTYASPEAPDRAAIVTMTGPTGKTLVYLDPYDGAVLDRVGRNDEAMMVVRRLHSLAYFGPVANGLIEIVAGFTLILVLSGIYLWWPRRQGGGQGGGVVTVRGTPARRVWWRDLHAVTGFLAGAGLFFLAATGLPWSILWGDQFRAVSNRAGLGQPNALWAGVPVSTVPMGAVLDTAGWALEAAPLPRSNGQDGVPIGIDRATEILTGLGMPAGYELALPEGPTGVYAAAAYPRDVTRQRMISLDQYTGRPLVNVTFGEIGLVGRGIQYGIGLHKGEFAGRLNQLLMLAFCLATILLAVTAAVMWWKRRPKGRLGVPAWPDDRRAVGAVTGLVAAFGIAFPLTGLAILAMIALDAALIGLRRGLRRPATA